jgi:hypothetical protein
MWDFLQLFTNIVTVPVLFKQVASIVILCLLAIEIISYLFLSRSFSVIGTQIKDLFTFRYPWDFFTVFTWLLLALMSIIYLRNSSPVSITYLITGLSIFFLGWLIRYQSLLLQKISKRFKHTRSFLRNYSDFWTKLKFHVIHARFFGPWLEIIGISIVARSFIFYPALFIFPVILGIGIIQKDKKLALTNQNIIPPAVKDLLPRFGHVLLFTLIPLSIATIVGIGSREFNIFYADIATARSILFTLSQIEGSIGVLAITIIFVLTQLTASNYSLRISAILFRQRAFWIPLIILFVSVGYNLIVASRSAILFPSNTNYFHSLMVDLSFIFGVATACGIAYFIFRAPRMISTESIITNSLNSFTKEWLDTIKRDWCRPNFQIKLNIRNDPFIIIERILSRAVDSGDSLTFVSGLILIRDHLQTIKTLDPRELPNYIIELDAYLRHHFRSLIRTAAKNSDAYTLLQLVYFIEELGDPSSESITRCDTFAFGFDEAAGELLLREIIRQSSAYQLTECLTRGIHVVESRAVEVIKTLPDQGDTWLYDPAKRDAKLSDEEKKTLWANDYRVENFERQYLSYFKSLGITAANSKSIEILRSVTLSLSNIISSTIQHINGNAMKAMMVRHAVWSLDEIRKASCNNKLSDAMSLSMLKYAAEHTEAEHNEEVAWYLIHYVSDFLLDNAKLGLLDYGDIVDSAMVGLKIVEKYTEPAAHLLESLGKAAKVLKQNEHYMEDQELQLVYNEIIRRIRQVGHDGPRKDPEQIASTVKSTLEGLGEPEFEERHKA